jgi:class 3 adenylate cyclase
VRSATEGPRKPNTGGTPVLPYQLRYYATVPAASPDQPRLLNATILFVDLMGSVSISNHLTVWEYNSLINDYQDELRQIMAEIRQSYAIGELYIGGDQLAVFFYDPADAEKQTRLERLRQIPVGDAAHLNGANGDGSDTAADIVQLETEMGKAQQRSLYGALRCAVAIKNAWIGHRRNIERVNTQQPMLDVGIGINSGQVVLQQRGDGQERIEGYAINFAKRVEGYARHGRYCKVMLSKRSYELFRQTVAAQAMLKQRAMFAPYEPQPGLLKGLAPGTKVFELKFFHRLSGFNIPEKQVPLFSQIFREDPTNLWAYVNLVNFYIHVKKDWEMALEVAQTALYSNTQNEKIYYDLALVSYNRGDFGSAKEYCARCIRLNDEMDMAYDLRGDIAQREGDWPEALRWRSQALTLAPESAGITLDVALAHAHLAHADMAARFFNRAVKLYPKITEAFDDVCAEVQRLVREAGGSLNPDGVEFVETVAR